MKKYRVLTLDRLKPECVEEYLRLHKEIWPGIEDLGLRSGITQISCFLNDLTLIVFIEYDAELYAQQREYFENNSLQIRWLALMKSLCEENFEKLTFDEVYRLSAPAQKLRVMV